MLRTLFAIGAVAILGMVGAAQAQTANPAAPAPAVTPPPLPKRPPGLIDISKGPPAPLPVKPKAWIYNKPPAPVISTTTSAH